LLKQDVLRLSVSAKDQREVSAGALSHY
jgi:hypothetical protein